MDALFCWAVIIQENRQSLVGWSQGIDGVFRSGTTGLGVPTGVAAGDAADTCRRCSVLVASCQTMSSGETKMLGTEFAAGMTRMYRALSSRPVEVGQPLQAVGAGRAVVVGSSAVSVAQAMPDANRASGDAESV